MDCTRRGFLVGTLGVGALAALDGCGQQPVAPDGTVSVVAGKAFLGFDKFPRLMAIGGGVTVGTEGGTPFAVIRTGVAAAVALNAVCTHLACTAVYQQAPPGLYCACHGSTFTIDGTVTHGPAFQPLAPSYPAVVGATGITVTIAG